MQDTSPIPPEDAALRLSRLRQQLRDSLQQFQEISWSLADSNPLIMGSYYQVYKTCSHPTCKCHKGHKHGPFPALSWSEGGKRRMVMVRAEDAARVEQGADAYRRYQKGLAQLRDLTLAIEKILVEIRSQLREEYR